MQKVFVMGLGEIGYNTAKFSAAKDADELYRELREEHKFE
jgi:hypothetical protein